MLKKKHLLNYSLGSTENEVLKIQGQPTSISVIGNSTTYFYSYSSVSFENGIVVSYDNSARNLKIRIKPQTQKTIAKKIGKYVYFKIPPCPMEYDRIKEEFISKEREISAVYYIPEFTEGKLIEIDHCITEDYKKWYEKNTFLLPVIMDDKNLILTLWKAEPGKLSNRGFACETTIGAIKL